jgi:catechol 2,3-dioxygenase-like lactoylglutathione lyase family enzyme
MAISFTSMDVYRISAITLKVKDMEKSCLLYSQIPGFRLAYGGKPSDSFTTFEIGHANNQGGTIRTYLNLELIEEDRDNDYDNYTFRNEESSTLETRMMKGRQDFGRIIFHVENVDKLYSYLKHDEDISKSIVFENEPINAPWGERFFHIREPNGYQLSFAQPLPS